MRSRVRVASVPQPEPHSPILFAYEYCLDGFHSGPRGTPTVSSTASCEGIFETEFRALWSLGLPPPC